MVVVDGAIMFVIGLQQADADAELKVQITGNGKRITVTDAGGDIEFALVSFFFPLQVVFSATCIETEEMSGECTAVHAFAQPVSGFQSAGKKLEAVFVMSISIWILTALCYGGFYVHDCLVLESGTNEVTAEWIAAEEPLSDLSLIHI